MQYEEIEIGGTVVVGRVEVGHKGVRRVYDETATLVGRSCGKCSQVKPVEEISRDQQTTDGLKSRCKTCVSAFEQGNRDRIAEQNRARQEVNRPGRLQTLVGHRFERWTVTGRGEDYVGPGGRQRRRWLVVCDCGNEGSVQEGSLKSGTSLSCGCLQRERSGGDGPAVHDLTGRRFGHLVVVGRGEDRITPGGTRRIMWRVDCDCGTEKLVQGNNLSCGNTTSCGCATLDINAPHVLYAYELLPEIGYGYAYVGITVSDPEADRHDSQRRHGEHRKQQRAAEAVGRGDATTRQVKDACGKPFRWMWWCKPEPVILAVVDSRQEALDLERRAIEAFQTPFNRDHNDDWDIWSGWLSKTSRM